MIIRVSELLRRTFSKSPSQDYSHSDDQNSRTYDNDSWVQTIKKKNLRKNNFFVMEMHLATQS